MHGHLCIIASTFFAKLCLTVQELKELFALDAAPCSELFAELHILHFTLDYLCWCKGWKGYCGLP